MARAIVAHPNVVVADEPTGDLDPDSSSQILGLLKRLKEQLDVTLLMVTHDAAAAEIADKQFRLDHGKLVQTGGTDVASGTGVPVGDNLTSNATSNPLENA